MVAGRFRLQALVGRGAAGEVWSAWDVSTWRQVALKLWAPVGTDSPWRERFDDELRLRRRLRHPDIQALLDSGVDRGRPWMALQWVEGDDLGQYAAPARRLDAPVVACKLYSVELTAIC